MTESEAYTISHGVTCSVQSRAMDRIARSLDCQLRIAPALPALCLRPYLQIGSAKLTWVADHIVSPTSLMLWNILY